jgi:uncharacterized RDD family membrane protein YckC
VPIDHEHTPDPYAPPRSDLDHGVESGTPGSEPAARGTRLAAVSLDGLLLTIPILPGMALAMFQAVRLRAVVDDMDTPGARLPDFGHQEGMIVASVAVVVGLLVAVGIAIYQWILISRTGQSLGKKWTGIRIQRIDGARVNFGTGVVLRNWVPKLMGAVPYLGLLFHLLDALFIFRDDRRCLHDHIAGTKVVQHRR